jgi:hypothetical protein
MRQTVAPGRVFFARANLAARSSEQYEIADIEPAWGTPGPLHFESEPGHTRD